RNLISGNGFPGQDPTFGGDGIQIASTLGPLSSQNVIAGNLIGTNAAGTAALANKFAGVLVAGGTGNRIGTDGSNDAFNVNERNIISGPTSGVKLQTSATSSIVAGNYIGVNVTGNAILGGGADGLVTIAIGSSNRI